MHSETRVYEMTSITQISGQTASDAAKPLTMQDIPIRVLVSLCQNSPWVTRFKNIKLIRYQTDYLICLAS